MSQSRLTIVPCELDEANTFVLQHHRHHDPATGHKFSHAVVDAAGDEAVPETLSVAVSMRVRRLRLARRLLRLVRLVPWLRARRWLATGVLRLARPEYSLNGGEWQPLAKHRAAGAEGGR